jgi:hypothetical protein
LIFSIGAKRILIVFDIGLIAAIGYFFDIFVDGSHAIRCKYLKELKEIFLF